jgi:16S rRNA (cytosine967-C5)-methyltransferase
LAIDLVKSNSVSPARLAAFEILRRVDGGAYASLLLAAKQADLKQPDRALLQELVLGVLRHQLFLDSLIEHFGERKAENIDQPVRLALRLGLYQLRFLTRIPDSAAVNESVNMTRIARVRSAGGFVNAVLRRATREPNYDPLKQITDRIEKLSVETSHPHWLISRWTNLFGLDFTTELAKSNNQTPPLSFRVVKNRASEQEVLERLQAAGATVVSSPITKDAWRLVGTTSVLMDMARAGEVYIQDDASQLVAQAVGPQKGELILDLCAAPGSKTSQLADLADNRAVLVAADKNEARLRTVTQTANLQKFSCIKAIVLDGLKELPFLPDSFDAVLVDAPCSGTGTFRRNPEIRWRISADDLQDLSARQKQLLSKAAGLVKPGGRLIYSTCSIETEENEEVLDAFLTSKKEFEQVDIGANPELITETNCVRTWPHRDAADGFFIASLRRRRS